jgi:DNA repair protein RadC
MTLKSIALEKFNAYGITSLSIEELKLVASVKTPDENFFASKAFFAMRELVRRNENKNMVAIKSSGDIYNQVSFLADYEEEEFWIILMSRANKIKKQFMLSRGGCTGTVVDIKLILREAIMCKAESIALVHNHPSGNTRPSEQDLTITSKVKQAAKIQELNLIDHVIVAGADNKGKYYSFADEGAL